MAEAAREGLLNALINDIESVPQAERASQGAEGGAMVRLHFGNCVVLAM